MNNSCPGMRLDLFIFIFYCSCNVKHMETYYSTEELIKILCVWMLHSSCLFNKFLRDQICFRFNGYMWLQFWICLTQTFGIHLSFSLFDCTLLWKKKKIYNGSLLFLVSSGKVSAIMLTLFHTYWLYISHSFSEQKLHL